MYLFEKKKEFLLRCFIRIIEFIKAGKQISVSSIVKIMWNHGFRCLEIRISASEEVTLMSASLKINHTYIGTTFAATEPKHVLYLSSGS